MGWTTNSAVQSGNSIMDHHISGSALSRQDAIVLKAYNMASWTSIERISLRITADGEPKYVVRVRVWGNNPVSFYFSGEKMD